MTEPPQNVSELDRILSRAVDRQLAEQRQLQQTLTELRDAIRTLSADTSTPLSADDVEERIRRALSDTAVPITTEVRALRDMVASPPEAAERTQAAVRALGDDVATIRDSVGSLASDIESVAQAILEMHASLRQWAEGLESSVDDLRGGVARVGDAAAEVLERAFPDGEDDEEDETSGRIEAVEERVRETTELSAYLADQIEDLDGLMSGLGELPKKLEGTVSQALRRAMAGRAKLDKQAEGALDDVLGDLDEHVDQLEGLIDRLVENEEQVRQLSLHQVELGSRVETLQDAVLDRLSEMADEQRRVDEALAAAIDRSSQGKTAKAKAELKKSSRRATRQKSSPRKKPARKKPAQRKKPTRRAAAKPDTAPDGE